MRVELKGIHTVKKRLANGSVQTYHYAWRGGPRLAGAPGTPEFVASFNAAVASRKTVTEDNLKKLIREFKASTDFDGLAARTKSDYEQHIAKIEEKFGDFPLLALHAPGARAEFLKWRDKLAKASKRQAAYTWTVLARILSWAKNRQMIAANPCAMGGRIYKAERQGNVWTADHEAAFMSSAPAHLKLALQLALWTGQRQGDLLRLPWSAYDGDTIRLKQGKTGARVLVPVGAPLKALLDTTPRRTRTILCNTDGEPWTEDGFRSSWRKACAKAKVVGVTFHDLRGTAITRLAIVGSTVAEIATLTGHSLKDVEAILDAHYLSRDVSMARSAVKKLEQGASTPVNRGVN